MGGITKHKHKQTKGRTNGNTHIFASSFRGRRRKERITPYYGSKRGMENVHVPRKLGDRWTSDAYTKTIYAACGRAGIAPWGANRLRHSFGTEVRRKFGLDAARAVLGHTEGGTITDIYSFDAIEEETIRAASAAVEALG